MRALTLLLVVCVAVAAAMQPWMNIRDTPEERAKKLLAQMTLEEKVDMCHGIQTSYCGTVTGNKRLNIPELHMEDGPQGVADGVKWTTAWPSALTAVATWDVDLMKQWGQAIAEEQRAKNVHITLGPMINLARVPQGGRNFESFGEDPFLAGEMVKSQVAGIQSVGVMACAKHYVDNNQEWERGTVSEDVPERAQYELYYPAFKAAVDAGVLSVMCSYNKINNTWACENSQTLGTALKGEMEYKYFVMSDWGGTHTTEKAALAGLDMEMPGSTYFGSTLLDAVKKGTVPESLIDDKVYRILVPMFKIGLFDRQISGDLNTDTRSEAHNQLAQKVAEAGTVLLKNQGGVLPLSRAALAGKKVAVIGDDAYANVISVGGGSGSVVLPYIVPPLTGVQRGAGYSRTQHNCSFEKDIDYYQTGSPEHAAKSEQECCDLCARDFNCRYFTYQASSNSCWLKETNAGRKQASGLVSGACQPPVPGNIQVTYTSSKNVEDAKKAAKAADVAIVFVGERSSEGKDRLLLNLPDEALVAAIAEVQNRTVVVLHSPAAALMPWADSVPAIVLTFMPGQEDGNALAGLLFGDVCPAGRLPISMPKTATDIWLRSLKQYPGEWGHAEYTEDLQMGYRWYASQHITPRFMFGHGLSYTTFAYSNLQARVSGQDEVTVTCTVKNTGTKYTAAEVAQLYLDYPASASEPPKQLRGFTKFTLAPLQSTTVTFTLRPFDVSYWNIAAHTYTVARGSFTAYVGSTWEQATLSTTFTL